MNRIQEQMISEAQAQQMNPIETQQQIYERTKHIELTDASITVRAGRITITRISDTSFSRMTVPVDRLEVTCSAPSFTNEFTIKVVSPNSQFHLGGYSEQTKVIVDMEKIERAIALAKNFDVPVVMKKGPKINMPSLQTR